MAASIAAGDLPTGWRGVACNPVPDSANEIHGDRVAQLYGFEGGLVPGVTVSAYLLQPAVEAWGRVFLDHGHAHVRVLSPLYDGDDFTVTLSEITDDGHEAVLHRADGTRCAVAEVRRAPRSVEVPVRRGDPLATEDWVGAPATPERFEALRAQGCRALRYPWTPSHRMARYLRDPSAMPELLVGPSALANSGFVLGVSNWMLAANAAMNPWVHLETTSQHHGAIEAGTVVVAEMTVVDFFEKKGHRFVDVTVTLFDEADDGALANVDLRAIYRLRGM